MIQFNYDWSDFLNQLIFVLAVAVLPMQLWLLVFRNSSGFTGRQALKLGLNVVLWVAVMGFILQPYLKRESSSATGIIFGKNVSSEFAKSLTDSLKSAEILDFSSLQDLESLASLDTVILAGADFHPSVFSTLLQSEHHPAIKYISYVKPDQLQELTWKAILRKGEMQKVKGHIKSSVAQVLKLSYGSQTLDSVKLNKETKSFTLNFPVFTEGRSSVDLSLNGKIIDTLRFYARPSEPLTFQFILDNPDFESRNLAGWLGKNGHSVLYTTALSKDIQSKLTINKAKDPDVVITDPGNASNSIVKKAVANGKSVLFINLTNPLKEIAAINGTLGTKIQTRRSSNEEAVTISPELTALPYQFVASNHAVLVPGYPVLVEKTRGNIGVSLLNETFPLMLTGDSVAYQKVWNAILAIVHPPTKSNIDLTAPIYQNLKTTINLNNFPKKPKLLQVEDDTVFLNGSALNVQSATGSFSPVQSGWLTLSDSLGTEMFVQNAGETFNLTKMQDFLRTYNTYKTRLTEAMIGPDRKIEEGIKRQFSSWMWFGIVMVCLAAVWVEGKL
ncbi:hypothetical protein [Dyadobacter psychrotolerans]|uniref:Uncharacterized protein n=1 Tax=Dyadobacter psychrotolerans TaxID=2541721 RepID=A0A4R5DUL2_9BACT|nr:hypothetical protein [Dyadobacter psychrotolerans]TDE18149.1 hypothetical protein E0F88_00980 [Dyadobacter psychrotolerans]